MTRGLLFIAWISAFLCVLSLPAASTELKGTWEGRYTCGKTETVLKLTLERDRNQWKGVFAFFLNPEDTNSPTGTYRVTATSTDEGAVKITRGKWIKRPKAYVALGLMGQVSADGKTMQGDMTGIRTCTTFMITRQGAVPEGGTPQTLAEALAENLAGGQAKGKLSAVKLEGRRVEEDYFGETIVKWTIKRPDIKGFDNKAHRLRKAFDEGVDVCLQIPESLDRSDCLAGREIVRKYTGIADTTRRYGLIAEACRSALYGKKDGIVACLVAAQSSPTSFTTLTSLLSRTYSCEQFTGMLQYATSGELPVEMRSLRGGGLMPGPQERICTAYKELRTERGLDGSEQSCGQGKSRSENLASCTGLAKNSDTFKAAWREAMAACERGERPVGVMERISAFTHRANVYLDQEISCEEVGAVVSETGIATAEEARLVASQGVGADGKRQVPLATHAYLTRVEELAGRRGIEFPRSAGFKDIVTTYEAAGLRAYFLYADVRDRQDEWRCIPKTIHVDIASSFLANNFAKALQASDNQLAWSIVSGPLSACYGMRADRWPVIRGRVLQLNYLGKPFATVNFGMSDSGKVSRETGWEIEAQGTSLVAPYAGFGTLQALLDDFWQASLAGAAVIGDTGALSREAWQNSDIASAALYSLFKLPLGASLRTATKADAAKMIDAALLGHPEAALIVANDIAGKVHPTDLVQGYRYLSAAEAPLLGLMNNLYAKGFVARYPPSFADVQQMSSLDLGMKEAVTSVEATGMRTTIEQAVAPKLGEGAPTATGLLTALNRYHDQDCSRYKPYNPNLGAIQFDVETELGNVSWVMHYRYERLGRACVLRNDFGSTPLGIRDVVVQHCAKTSGDAYACDLQIRFECPVRGMAPGIPQAGRLIGRVCEIVDAQWSASISATVRRANLAWTVQSHSVTRVSP